MEGTGFSSKPLRRAAPRAKQEEAREGQGDGETVGTPQVESRRILHPTLSPHSPAQPLPLPLLGVIPVCPASRIRNHLISVTHQVCGRTLRACSAFQQLCCPRRAPRGTGGDTTRAIDTVRGLVLLPTTCQLRSSEMVEERHLVPLTLQVCRFRAAAKHAVTLRMGALQSRNCQAQTSLQCLRAQGKHVRPHSYLVSWVWTCVGN